MVLPAVEGIFKIEIFRPNVHALIHFSPVSLRVSMIASQKLMLTRFMCAFRDSSASDADNAAPFNSV